MSADHFNDVALSIRDARVSSVVAIPVRNEGERIGACLTALSGQAGLEQTRFGILLFLNNCTDETEAVVDSLIESIAWPVKVIRCFNRLATAGWARGCAMDAASDWLLASEAADGTILTTDADSRVGRFWVRDNLIALDRGADAVAGRFILDPQEAAQLPNSLHARGRLEARYESFLAEIEARLDPEPGNPWPCHRMASGASLAVRRSIYVQVGGMPPLALGEDRAFVEAIRAGGGRVRHDPKIEVVTSGRLLGRAPGGAADTMKLRCDEPDSPCDEQLEPVFRAVFRISWKRRLRHLYARGNLEPMHRWTEKLRIGREAALRLPTTTGFLRFFKAVEAASPRLSRQLLRPTDLSAQIGIAMICACALRLRDFLTKVRISIQSSYPLRFDPGHRSDLKAATIPIQAGQFGSFRAGQHSRPHLSIGDEDFDAGEARADDATTAEDAAFAA